MHWRKNTYPFFLNLIKLFCLSSSASVSDSLTHSYSFSHSHCPQCFQSLFSYSALAQTPTAHRQKKYCHRLLKQESMKDTGQRNRLLSLAFAHTHILLPTSFAFTCAYRPELLLLCASALCFLCFHMNALCVPKCACLSVNVCFCVSCWLFVVAMEAAAVWRVLM